MSHGLVQGTTALSYNNVVGNHPSPETDPDAQGAGRLACSVTDGWSLTDWLAVGVITLLALSLYRFTARRWDTERSGHYFRWRNVKPHIGRFLSRDPLGQRVSRNLYVQHFVPWNVDPFGLDDADINPDTGLPWGYPGPGDEGRGPVSDEQQEEDQENFRKMNPDLPDTFGIPTGTSTSADLAFIAGGGGSTVRCEDANCCQRTMVFAKACAGAIIGGSATENVVIGMHGHKCTPKSYEGYFLELGAGIWIVGGGLNIGYKTEKYGSVKLPGKLSGVYEVGGGIGITKPYKRAGFTAAWCRYYLVLETIDCPGKQTEYRTYMDYH